MKSMLSHLGTGKKHAEGASTSPPASTEKKKTKKDGSGKKAGKEEEIEDGQDLFKYVSKPTTPHGTEVTHKRILLKGEEPCEDHIDDDSTVATLVPTQGLSEADKEQLHGRDPELVDLLLQNRAWVKQQHISDPEFFPRLGRGQDPKYFYVGCCDSRVDPNALMGLPSGSLFVHRNIGNVVCPCDMNCHSALEYAVEVLKVDHILVVGHYDCGAVKGSMATDVTLPPLVEYWVRNIRDVQRNHQEELQAVADPLKRQRRLVELNVVEQCLNIFKVGAVQRRRRQCAADGKRFLLPRIHGLVFDPADGILVKLNLQFNKDAGIKRSYELLSDARTWFGDQKAMEENP